MVQTALTQNCNALRVIFFRQKFLRPKSLSSQKPLFHRAFLNLRNARAMLCRLRRDCGAELELTLEIAL